MFAVGRVWPWHAPGLTILDGIQIGRQSEDQTKEAASTRAFPSATTVAPSTAAWATGAYGTLVETGGTRKAAVPPRPAGGADRDRERCGDGTLTDAEARAQPWLGAWHVCGGGRALRAPMLAPGRAIDRAYLDLGARPSDPFGVGLHIRYFSGTPCPRGDARGGDTRGGEPRRGDRVHWDLASRIGVVASGGLTRDRDTSRSLAYVAAELRLPRVAATSECLSGGLQLDTGWLEGG